MFIKYSLIFRIIKDPKGSFGLGRLYAGDMSRVHRRHEREGGPEEARDRFADRCRHTGTCVGHVGAQGAQLQVHQAVRVGRSRRDVVARFQGADPRCLHQDALQHPGRLVVGHHAHRGLGGHQEVHERPHSYLGQEGGVDT